MANANQFEQLKQQYYHNLQQEILDRNQRLQDILSQFQVNGQGIGSQTLGGQTRPHFKNLRELNAALAAQRKAQEAVKL
ncbi:MAG: hypothetical protein ACREGF_06545, partial [Candidatus Saccharimonadales bacterium]